MLLKTWKHSRVRCMLCTCAVALLCTSNRSLGAVLRLFLGAILDRQGLLVAAPIDLRTKKAESFSPQLLQGFWFKRKRKNPKIVGMSPTVTAKNSKQKEVIWQKYRLSLAVVEHQILGGKHFRFGDQSQERFGG